MSSEEPPVGHPMRDDGDRLSKFATVFSRGGTLTTSESAFKGDSRKYERLSIDEMKIWWDLTSLEKYIEEFMVPRGLRIKKIPSTVYSEQFVIEWNSILTNCSLDLMRLIVKEEKAVLQKLHTDMDYLKKSLSKYNNTQASEEFEYRLQNTLSQMETEIMEIKHVKYLRDVQDYETDMVYEWGRWQSKFHKSPRSILKKSAKHVSFGSASASMPQSDLSDSADSVGSVSSRGSVSSVFSRDPQDCELSKNGKEVTYYKFPRKKGRGDTRAKESSSVEQVESTKGKRYPQRKKDNKR